MSNPRPSAYKADALPLSYKGADTICRHNLLDCVPCSLAVRSAEASSLARRAVRIVTPRSGRPHFRSRVAVYAGRGSACRDSSTAGLLWSLSVGAWASRRESHGMRSCTDRAPKVRSRGQDLRERRVGVGVSWLLDLDRHSTSCRGVMIRGGMGPGSACRGSSNRRPWPARGGARCRNARQMAVVRLEPRTRRRLRCRGPTRTARLYPTRWRSRPR